MRIHFSLSVMLLHLFSMLLPSRYWLECCNPKGVVAMTVTDNYLLGRRALTISIQWTFRHPPNVCGKSLRKDEAWLFHVVDGSALWPDPLDTPLAPLQ
jgi:hypothetical protein